MSEALLIAIIWVTAILTTGSVLILRPIAKRVGSYLDAVTEARLRPVPQPDMARLNELLSSIDSRLNQIEERQDFAEALISASDPKMLTVPTSVRVPERN